MFKIVEFSHLLINEYLKRNRHQNMTFIDATCGRGNDTIYMANILKDIGHVYSYDIQQIAIDYTKELLDKENITNVTLFNESHEFIKEVDIDLIIYNLGYLPNGDKNITTKCDTTLSSIKKMITLMELNPKMLIIIVIYPGHFEGKRESDAINNYVKSLPSNTYLVTKYLNYNQETSPYIITISKDIK